MTKKITCADAVLALKAIGLSSSAKCIALRVGSDSRAVVTALRKATTDGRVKTVYRNGIAFYRFIRLKPKTPP